MNRSGTGPVACHRCGEKFDRTNGRIYCSDACTIAAKRAQKLGTHRRSKRQLVNCESCGGAFERVYQPTRPAKYCSDECRNLGRARVRGWSICPCGKAGRSGYNGLCEEHHEEAVRRQAEAMAAAAAARAEREQQIKAELHCKMTCADCGRSYIRNSGVQMFCSSVCSERHARRERRYAERAGAGRSDHPRGRVFRAMILERDGWRCHICGKPINPGVRFPDRLSPTIDHLIPIAHGGAHVETNCRAAHLTCNIKRGTSGEAQLILA